MTTESPITFIDHSGHRCLKLVTVHGIAIVALHGGHVVSWVPNGQHDVFWLSPMALPEPAAIRGGVPVCWPWFAKQDMPAGAMQHGPVRNTQWHLSAVLSAGPECVELELRPAPAKEADSPMAFTRGLDVALRICLRETLEQTLTTTNLRATPFSLTQALHSYFAVGDVQQVHVDGLEGAQVVSRLEPLQSQTQAGPVMTGEACDSTYCFDVEQPAFHYQLVDAAWRRTITLEVSGSRSMVVWNPGQVGAKTMVDVPSAAWKDFICVEASNAGDDVVLLEPGGSHSLRQWLSCKA